MVELEHPQKSLDARDARYGLVSICAAGAMAGAFLLERQGAGIAAVEALTAVAGEARQLLEAFMERLFV